MPRDVFARPEAVPSLDELDEEVQSGLQSHADRMEAAWKADQYYQLKNEQFLERRSGEDEDDWKNRPKLTSNFARAVVDKLTEIMYAPGPQRQAQGSFSAWLEQVYADLFIDALMGEADRTATLSGVCGLQVEATGIPERPIRCWLWKPHEFTVWTRDGDPRDPWAVCTVDSVPAGPGKIRWRYRLWSALELRTYLTEPFSPQDNLWRMGVRRAAPVDAVPNPYPGVLPFAWVHDQPPVCDFWQGGLANALVRINRELDRKYSNIGQHVESFLNPIRWARNISVGARFLEKIGGFLHLKGTAEAALDGTNATPEIGVLQSQLAVEEAWLDARNYANQQLEELGVPLRLDSDAFDSGLSGIAIALRTIVPLQQRQAKRQPLFTDHETGLFSLICAVAGSWYKQAELLRAARDPSLLTVSWPPPRYPIPSEERDASDRAELQLGLTDPIELLARRRGLTIEQAIAVAEEIADRLAEWDRIFGERPPAMAPPGTPKQDRSQEQEQENDPEEPDEGDDGERRERTDD